MTDLSSLKNSQRIKFLLKDSFLYGAASSLNKAFSLITFPLLSRYFSITDYGTIDLFLVITSFLTILFVFGQDSAIARYFYEYEDDVKRRDLISESLAIQIILCVIALPVLWVLSDWIVSFVSTDTNIKEIFKINLITIPFLVCINFSRNLLKWTFSRAKFLIISLGSVFLYMIILLVGVFYFEINIRGYFLIVFVTNAFFGLLALFYVRKWLKFPRNWSNSRELLKYATPFGIICCLSSFVPILERSLVSMLIGSDQLGLYAAGAKVAMLLGVIVQSFQTAWGPFSISIHKQENAIVTYNWVLKFYTLGICFFVLSLSYFAEYLLHFLASSKYDGASIVVFPLSMALAIQSISWITEIGIGISKRSYLSLYSYCFFVFTTGISIYFLAGEYGLLGVAFGVLIGYSCNALLASYLSFKAYRVKWDYQPVFIFLFLVLILGIILNNLHIHTSFYISLILFLIIQFALIIFGYIILFDKMDRVKIIVQLREKFYAKKL